MSHEQPGLAELAEAYPYLSVARGRAGQIIVINKERRTRTILSLQRYTHKQLVADVVLTVSTDTDSQGRPLRDAKSYIVVRPHTPARAIADVGGPEDLDIVPGRILKDARHGLEIFRAMFQADRSTRVRMQPIAFDYLQEEDVLIWASSTHQRDEIPDGAEVNLQRLGLSREDVNPSPLDMHSYMYKVINRPIIFTVIDGVSRNVPLPNGS